jgi:adenylosuccinate synthase
MKDKESSIILVADLGFGDAGKGSIVDALTRKTNAHCVVRYNGGAQAAHNVITPDGRHHTFAQFGSGTFIPGTQTHLSRFMMVHPLAMLAEERHLQSFGVSNAFPRTSIDRQALITTPFHQSANRLKETALGDGRHGSCGMGIGETMSDWLAHGSSVLFAGDLDSRETIIKKLTFLRETKMAQLEGLVAQIPHTDAARRELEIFSDPKVIPAIADIYVHFATLVKLVEPGYLAVILNQRGTTIFEGAQGVLLDEWWGFYPYNTWSTLTFANADTLLRENNFGGKTFKLGLTRAYATRHGAGPFVTEDEQLTAKIQDSHNENNPWQRQFRVGYLDFVALRYALKVIGPIDGLAVTNLDRLDEIPQWRFCDSYRYSNEQNQAAEFFDFRSQQICDIKIPSDPTDLAKQEALTRTLMEMQPVYEDCQKDKNAYLRLVSEKLEAPIAMTSFGPTAQEKHYFFKKVTRPPARLVYKQLAWTFKQKSAEAPFW